MAMYHDAKCRLCRREGMKLFLKGDRAASRTSARSSGAATPRASTARAAGPRRPNYGDAAAREAEGAPHLRRARAAVPQLLRQGGERQKGVTGEVLLQMLERRLDNVVYRLGFAPSRSGRAPARAPRPLHGERPQGGHPVVPVRAGRRDPWSTARRAGSWRSIQNVARGPQGRTRCPSWLELDADEARRAAS